MADSDEVLKARAVPDLENWNTDRTVYPFVMTRGLMGKDVGGTWRYLQLNSSGQLVLDSTALDARYVLKAGDTMTGMLEVDLSGYSGLANTKSLYGHNSNTATTAVGVGGNYGVYGLADGVTVGDNAGTVGQAQASTGANYGLLGLSLFGGSGANVGVAGVGYNSGTGVAIGGFFGLLNASATYASAALMADNGTTGKNIFVARENGTAVLTVATGGLTTLTGNLVLPTGTSAAPSLSFATGSGTGLYGYTSTAFHIACNGALHYTVSSSGFVFRSTSSSYFLDGSLNKYLQFIPDSSAVNYLSIKNANTGVSPIFAVAGTDSNIDINITPKGTGGVVIPAGTRTALALRIGASNYGIWQQTGLMEFVINGGVAMQMYNGSLRWSASTVISDSAYGNAWLGFVSGNTAANSATNYFALTNGGTGVQPIISAIGGDTNIGIDYVTKGTGLHRLKNPGTGATVKVWGAGGSSSSIQFASGVGETSLGFISFTSGTLAIQNGSAGKYGVTFGIPASGTPTTNYPAISFGTAGNPVTFSALGDDVNIGITLTPKGTGNVTVSANALIAPYFQTSTAPTANSTGTVAIVAKDAGTATNNAGWLPMKDNAGNLIYIPYWT